MSTTTSGNLDRKSLRRPDDFMQAVSKFFDAINDNSRTTLVVLGVFFLIGLGYAFTANQKSVKAEHGREALYKARSSLETTLSAMLPAPAKAAPAAKDAKKKGKDEAKDPAQEQAAAMEALEYKKLDVDSQFADAIKQLQAVAHDYEGSRSAYEARLTLGDLYYQHGQAEKSIAWYQTAIDHAPNSFEKALATTALGYAYENSGKPADAAATYDKAIKLGESPLKGDLMLALARTQAASGDQAKAKNTYDQILSQMPNTEHAKLAESLKAKLAN